MRNLIIILKSLYAVRAVVPLSSKWLCLKFTCCSEKIRLLFSGFISLPVCASRGVLMYFCAARTAAGQRRGERSDGLHRHVPSHHVRGRRRRGGQLPAHQARLLPRHRGIPRLRGRRRRHQLLPGEYGEGAAGGLRPTPVTEGSFWWAFVCVSKYTSRHEGESGQSLNSEHWNPQSSSSTHWAPSMSAPVATSSSTTPQRSSYPGPRRTRRRPTRSSATPPPRMTAVLTLNSSISSTGSNAWPARESQSSNVHSTLKHSNYSGLLNSRFKKKSTGDRQ